MRSIDSTYLDLLRPCLGNPEDLEGLTEQAFGARTSLQSEIIYFVQNILLLLLTAKVIYDTFF